MNTYKWLFGLIIAAIAFPVAADNATGDIMLTRHFTGLWEQVNQESQGISFEIVEQLDDSRVAVAYWYTYGQDKKSAWYVGIGPYTDNHADLDLYYSSDVGFMQDAQPDNNPVTRIGTMRITFDSCNSGVVNFDSTQAEVGSGSFPIQRLTSVMNTYCTGGMSDDMDVHATHGEQRVEFTPVREGMNASGHARYEDTPGSTEFEIVVEGLPDGNYHLYTGMEERGEFAVQQGYGKMEFHSPMETGKYFMTFDPRGLDIEIHDGSGPVLIAADHMSGRDDRDQGGYGDDHGQGGNGQGGSGDDHGQGGNAQDCDGGMGGGMGNCMADGEYTEIQVRMNNTGFLPDARGEAEWEMTNQRVEFSVEIEDIPTGSYALLVGGSEVGTIVASNMHGKVYGRIEFRDPEMYGMNYLDFDPRGQTIAVMQQNDTILEVDFPLE